MEVSSFQGVIEEIPNILVDHFVQVKDVCAFFLSHCHADHMKGLNSPELLSFLHKNNSVTIYCSKVTKAIISNWTTYTALSPFVKPIEVNQNVIVDLIKNDQTKGTISELVVTLIPTGHCPGSVMFLFEGTFGTVLYSGDLRIATRDCSKLKGLMNNPSKPNFGLKTIDHLYLDCTFCYQSAQHFPTRDESVEEIAIKIKEWVARGLNHKVFFSLAGRGFGAEFVFVEIYKKLKMPTHVSQFKYSIYKSIPEIHSAVSLDPKCRIHACEDNGIISPRKSLQCTNANHKILTIRLTTQWHLIKGKNPNFQTIVENGGILRTLFSMHSSLEELQSFVSCLRPNKITPIAKPDSVSNEEISQLLCSPVCSPKIRIENNFSKKVTIKDESAAKRQRILEQVAVEIETSRVRVEVPVNQYSTSENQLQL